MSQFLNRSSGRPIVAALSLLCSVVLLACGGGVTVEGRVEGAGGPSNAQGVVPRMGAAPEGSLVVAEVLVEGRTGSGDVVAQTTLQADGSYRLTVPEGEQRLLIAVYADEAALEAGTALSSGVLDATVGAKAGVRTMHPLNAETQLEAAVFAELAREQGPASVDTVDLRARIDAEMALAWSSMDATAAAEATTELAVAIRLAQRTRIEAYADAGVTVTQNALFEASLEAAAALDAALDAGTSAETAWAAFHASQRAAVMEQTEAEDETVSGSEQSASAAFRLQVDAKVDSQALQFAAYRRAAILEARASNLTINALLEAGGAGQAIIDAASNQGDLLVTALISASQRAEITGAFSTWALSIGGGSRLSVMGTFLELDAQGSASLEALVAAQNTAHRALELTLETAWLTAGLLNVEALAQTTAEAFATYRAEVVKHLSSSDAFGAKGPTAVGILVTVNGALTLG